MGFRRGPPSNASNAKEKTGARSRHATRPLGTNGLAWGIGVAGQKSPAAQIRKRQAHAGRIFGSAKFTPTSRPCRPAPTIRSSRSPRPIAGSKTPRFHTTTNASRIVLESADQWFKKQQMKQDDFAHHWKIEIRHNADPPSPARAARSFHIQRGPEQALLGCTTMPEPAASRAHQWLRADAHPHYVLCQPPNTARNGKPGPCLRQRS